MHLPIPFVQVGNFGTLGVLGTSPLYRKWDTESDQDLIARQQTGLGEDTSVTFILRMDDYNIDDDAAFSRKFAQIMGVPITMYFLGQTDEHIVVCHGIFTLPVEGTLRNPVSYARKIAREITGVRETASLAEIEADLQ